MAIGDETLINHAPEAATAPAAGDGPATHRRSTSRPTAEFLLVLLAGILFIRAFTAEAYIVPTGSMAPTLLGMHRDILCPNCGKRFSIGVDEQGRSGRAVCPNCGQTELHHAPTTETLGDRLLVQKFLFDFRAPKRWEVAVFQNPADPSQAYVKRIVGLPEESVLLWGGDVYIDGRIARKTLAEARAMSIPVYDHNFTPRDLRRYPRWGLRRDGGRDAPKSAWVPEGSRFVHRPAADASDAVDWVEYRHWQPDRGNYGPVRDFTPYNGADVPGDHRVNDLIVSARVSAGAGVEAVLLRIDSGGDHFVVTFPTDRSSPASARRNGRKIALNGPGTTAPAPDFTRPRRVEMAIVDRRLSVAVDGVPAFSPVDFDEVTTSPRWSSSPISLGVRGDGPAEIADIRIERDVYYTESLSQTPRRPFGVEIPYALAKGEYFVLGDNSPVSNDSRFWQGSPAVSARHFLGKPFLVHLPSQAVPLRVFGSDVYWIPDPREIRYIR